MHRACIWGLHLICTAMRIPQRKLYTHWIAVPAIRPTMLCVDPARHTAASYVNVGVVAAIDLLGRQGPPPGGCAGEAQALVAPVELHVILAHENVTQNP